MTDNARSVAAYRQGDICCVPIETLPQDLIPASTDAAGRTVLAYGEVTGHAHVLDSDRVQAFRFDIGAVDEPDVIVVGGSGATLRHEDVSGGPADHKPIDLPPGAYRVIRQREFSELSPRRVVD